MTVFHNFQTLINNYSTCIFLQKKSLDNPNQFEKLIDLVTVMPHNNQDLMRGYRYPFYACQMLKDQQIYIFDKFFKENKLIYLLALLDSEFNDVLAGYLLQILQNLHSHRPIEFLTFFSIQHHYIDKFISLSEQNSISKIISLFLKYDLEGAQEQIFQVQIYYMVQIQREKMISQILTTLQQTSSNQIIQNLTETLSVIKDVDDNYKGQQILEFLINNPVFLSLITQNTSMYYELLIELINALFPYEKPTTMKSFQQKITQVNSLLFQKTLLNIIIHQIPQYVNFQIQKISVQHLRFFIVMQKFSYAKTPICRCFFGNSLLWNDLIICMKNYPKSNMMHAELVKIFRNGVRYSQEDNVEVCNLDQLIQNIIEIFSMERQQTQYYFGFVMQISFLLKKYTLQKQQQIQESWKIFEIKHLQKEVDRGNTPLDDQRVIDPNSPLNVNLLSIEKIDQDIITDDYEPIKLKLIQLD